MNQPHASPDLPRVRTSAIVVAVLLLHVGGLWALQSGLLHRIVADLVVPAEVLIDMSPAEAEPAPPKPQPPLAPPTPRTPAPQPAPTKAQQTAPPPLAVPATATEPDNAALSPAPVAMATTTANTASALGTSNTQPPPGTAVAAPRAPALELPSSDAQFLNNPTPAYPALSKRMGEQGKVVIRAFIGVDGVAQQAQIKQSSGYDRLDQTSLATALKWRYVPGKRAGVAEAMWFDVPFTWVLR